LDEIKKQWKLGNYKNAINPDILILKDDSLAYIYEKPSQKAGTKKLFLNLPE